MIKVDDFEINWRYGIKLSPSSKKVKVPDKTSKDLYLPVSYVTMQTTCIIRRKGVEVIETVGCHSGDVYSKPLGRKLALKRALTKLFLLLGDFTSDNELRVLRTKIWKEYFKHMKE